MPANHRARFLSGLHEISAADWDNVTGGDYPFMQHRFLMGLETSGCISAETGWQPCHLVLESEASGTIIAVMPLYLKSHSYGEYVFDWSWAEAWERSGQAYYPKLVTAIPFTPATGPRLCSIPDIAQDEAWSSALAAVKAFADRNSLSSWHVLFTDQTDTDYLQRLGMHCRVATQFHWQNEGYSSFDDFLSALSSRKRKSIRRERRRIEEQELELTTLVGEQISAEDWQRFHHFYQLTYAKRSGHGGYLNREFFTDVAAAMGDQVIMVVARSAGRAVAAALYFRSAETLYGRYWGCEQEFDCLHFEACYYRGIDFCIENGLKRFDPGAQGEHKIQRGFRPVHTLSNHWIADPRLSQAVADFTERERIHSESYLEQANTLLPFRSG